MVMVFTAIVCGSRRYFSRLSMLSSLPTHLQMNGLPPLTITHRIGLFVLHVVTGGEYESSCHDLEAVVPLGVGVCIRSGRFLIRTSGFPVRGVISITPALT